MSTLCAALIVKNEESVISRCIDSFKDHIDYWVICDTGSTDNTKQIITEKLQGIPGELHDREWKNFGHNRSELMKLCRNKADYIILLDADMTLQVNQGNFRDSLSSDSMKPTSYLLKYEGVNYFRQKLLVRGDLDWRYEGVTHEYIVSDQDNGEGVTDLISLVHFADGSRHSYKNQEDVRLLEQSIMDNANNPRDMFYLAQSYECNGQRDEARDTYGKRAQMEGWDQETYISMLREAECISKDPESMNFPLGLYIKAMKYRPSRFEAAYRVINYIRRKELYTASYALSLEYMKKPATEDILFVDQASRDYKIPLEFALSNYWTGKKDVCKRVCEDKLNISYMPLDFRQCYERLLDFCRS